MSQPKTKISLKKMILITLGMIIIITVVWYQIYLHADYSDMFIQDKGTIVTMGEKFIDHDSLFNNYNLNLTDSKGLELSCLVRTPRDTARNHAGILVMNGFDTGKKVISLFKSTEKAVLISFDWPYEGQRKFKGADIGPFLPHIRRSIFRAVSVVSTMVDYLQQRDDVDPEKIFVIGASFGAPFAVNAAAVDQRIKAVILLYGGGDIGKLVESSSKRQVTTALGRKILGWFIAGLLAPVEPLKYVDQISPRPLLMINGKQDQSIWGESAQLLFDQAREPKKIIWMDTPHVKPKLSDLTQIIEKTMKEWLENEGLL